MTKINKLARDVLGFNINYIPENQRLERVTGKTTGIILKQISDAILNPESIVKIGEFGDRRDHRSGGFIDQLIEMIDKLELKYMYVNRVKGDLVYRPFEEVEDKVEATTVTISGANVTINGGNITITGEIK